MLWLYDSDDNGGGSYGDGDYSGGGDEGGVISWLVSAAMSVKLLLLVTLAEEPADLVGLGYQPVPGEHCLIHDTLVTEALWQVARDVLTREPAADVLTGRAVRWRTQIVVVVISILHREPKRPAETKCLASRPLGSHTGVKCTMVCRSGGPESAQKRKATWA